MNKNESIEEKYVNLFISFFLIYILYKKKYETWNGSNYFFCKGYIFFGPQSFRPLVVTTLLITTPNVVFLSYNFEVM